MSPKITFKKNILGEDDYGVYHISIWKRTAIRTTSVTIRHSSEKICECTNNDEKKCKANAKLIIKGLKLIK